MQVITQYRLNTPTLGYSVTTLLLPINTTVVGVVAQREDTLLIVSTNDEQAELTERQFCWIGMGMPTPLQFRYIGALCYPQHDRAWALVEVL